VVCLEPCSSKPPSSCVWQKRKGAKHWETHGKSRLFHLYYFFLPSLRSLASRFVILPLHDLSLSLSIIFLPSPPAKAPDVPPLSLLDNNVTTPRTIDLWPVVWSISRRPLCIKSSSITITKTCSTLQVPAARFNAPPPSKDKWLRALEINAQPSLNGPWPAWGQPQQPVTRLPALHIRHRLPARRAQRWQASAPFLHLFRLLSASGKLETAAQRAAATLVSGCWLGEVCLGLLYRV